MTSRLARRATIGGGSCSTYHRHEVFSTIKPPISGPVPLARSLSVNGDHTPISGPMNGDAVYTIIGAESSLALLA